MMYSVFLWVYSWEPMSTYTIYFLRHTTPHLSDMQLLTCQTRSSSLVRHAAPHLSDTQLLTCQTHSSSLVRHAAPHLSDTQLLTCQTHSPHLSDTQLLTCQTHTGIDSNFCTFFCLKHFIPTKA